MAAWKLLDASRIVLGGMRTQGELYIANSGPDAVEVWVEGSNGPYLIPPGQEAVFGNPGLLEIKRSTANTISGFWWFVSRA